MEAPSHVSVVIGDVQRCLQVLDLGLLLGAPVTGVRLVDFAQRLQTQTLLFATNVSKSALHVPDPVHALLQMDTSGQKENANEDVGVHLIGTKPDGHRCTYSEPNAADATANAPTNAVDDNLRPSKILRRVQDGDDASSSSCTSMYCGWILNNVHARNRVGVFLCAVLRVDVDEF